MNKILNFIIVAILALLLVFYLRQKSAGKSIITSSTPTKTIMIKVISAVFKNGEMIPKKYTCDGEDVSPPLTIEGVPTNAKSLTLIVDDPDAPMGTWNHWLVWNIDPKTKEIGENSVPAEAVLGTNDFGKLDYGGPCPPSGTHRYFFKVYAFDTVLNLPQGAKRNELETAMKNHILDQEELMGKYSR